MMDRVCFGGKKGVSGWMKWVWSKPSPKEVNDLARRYSEVAKLPEDEINGKTKELLAKRLVARMLGQRVLANAAAHEFRLCAGLNGDVAPFNLEQGFFLFRFQEAGEWDAIFGQPWVVFGHPWVVFGQALAMESWRPRFYPSLTSIHLPLVWVRLPQLLVELSGLAMLRSIVCLAGDLVAVDECTMERRRAGFAWVYIRLDLSRLLWPGMLISCPEGNQWLGIIYENLDGVCFWCSFFHGLKESCSRCEDG